MEYLTTERGEPICGVLNAGDQFWLPADTPFGNLGLKLHKVFDRLGHANLRLEESHRAWHRARTDDVIIPSPISEHHFAAEESVFMIRRSADELIGTLWLVECRATEGTWPTRIKVDDVGGLLATNNALANLHQWILTTLNEMANAHKHSFVYSDINILGRDQPCAIALTLKRNDLAKASDLYVVALDDIVRAFNSFFHQAPTELRELMRSFPGSPTYSDTTAEDLGR